jgi:hypothetical protein
MYTKVLHNQFVIKDGSIVHMPTGAEFTPVSGAPDSLLVWTGEVGSVLETGELYRYADVFAMMKTVWQQAFRPRNPRSRLKYVINARPADLEALADGIGP